MVTNTLIAEQRRYTIDELIKVLEKLDKDHLVHIVSISKFGGNKITVEQNANNILLIGNT